MDTSSASLVSSHHAQLHPDDGGYDVQRVHHYRPRNRRMLGVLDIRTYVDTVKYATILPQASNCGM